MGLQVGIESDKVKLYGLLTSAFECKSQDGVHDLVPTGLRARKCHDYQKGDVW